MPETPADSASLTILAGPLKGQRLVLEDAVDDILIGSDPDCRLCLDVPGVSPIHARLWLDPEGATLYDTHSASGVYVNDDRVHEQAPLRDGDIVWLGAPAEAGSVMLQFRHPGAVPPVIAAREALPEPPAEPDAFEVSQTMREAEPLPPVPPAPEAPAADDDWLIEDTGQPPASVSAAATDPLESVLEGEGLEWPPPEPAVRAVAGAPPPAAAAAAPELPDDFYVIEEPEPPEEAAPMEPSSAVEAEPRVDEDLFDWGAESEPAPRAGEPPPPEPPPAELAADEALLLDWSEPAHPEPAATPPPAPAVAPPPVPPPPVAPPPVHAAPMAAPPARVQAPPPPPIEDDDVFYVESAQAPEPPPPPAAPRAAARPVAAAEAAPSRVPAPTPAKRVPPHPPAAMPEGAATGPAVVGGIHVPRPRPAPGAESSRPAPAAPPPRPSGGRLGGRRVLIMAGGAVLAVAVAALIALKLLGAPRVDSIQPTRVRGGDTVVIQGQNFSADPAGVVVRFEGRREGRILRASPTRLEVEVPSIPAAPGRVNRVPVAVSVGGRESQPVEISVYQAPRIHGIAPSVAMAGEEVTLAGSDWGGGATVRFGGHQAQIVELSPTSIRARVPAVNAPEGTALPVVVAMGGDASNEVPFHLGRLPLLLSIEPRAVNFGDTLVIKGMGFAAQPSANDLRVGGTRAVVVKSSDTEILALVPRTPADGQNAVELRVPGTEHVAQSTLTVAAAVEPVEFRFIVEHPSAVGIEDPENGHDHVVLSTGLGPAFLISAAEGASAAERAVEAQRRLNEAAVALKAALTADLEVRNLDGQPSIGLVGRQDPLLIVTGEDAAAYDEDWARGKGRAEAVTPARLALWWGAVARDLVLLLVRGDRPRHAAALAPEGRALAAVHDAARRTGRFGVPREVVAAGPAALRQGIRGLALRVPAAVKAPAEAAAAAAPVQALTVDGLWTGSETGEGGTRYMTVTFAGGSGTFTYERALSLTIPLQSVEQTGRRDLRFEFRSGIHLRRYEGTWDGQRLRGRIVAEDGAEIGRFELERKR